MPEEGKPDSKFVEEMYTDSRAGDKFWIKDSKSYEGKQEKERLDQTFIFKDGDDERVVLLMGSDCSSTEDLMMDDQVLSDWSSELLFNIDNLTSSVITTEEINIDDDHGENTKLSLAETKNKESQDQVIEDMISYNKELDKEVEESVSTIQQYSGSIPYSGSISIRSTSSTASTQSFAFPILGQEFISSPVRMPKPDKRQLTKQKHWKKKMCWVCCKF